MFKTLDAFVQFAATAIEKSGGAERVHTAFEMNCTPQVRDEVYEFADPRSPEPFRSALTNLGVKGY